MKSLYTRYLPALIVLFTLVAGGVQAQPDFKNVQENIAQRLSNGDMLGVSIVYVYPDGSTQFITRGSLTTAREETVQQQTIFEIGSVSKTFTALMMMKMAEDGMFALDTPIRTVLPDSVDVPAYEGKEITLKHLATHTSGLPRMPSNFAPANPQDPYADYGAEQLYAFLESYSLSKAPGSSVAYSNYGMGLLGHLLERASGKSYEALLEEYITGPLTMDDTSLEVPAGKQRRFAAPYNYGQPVSHWNFDVMAAAGGIRSTVTDMATYMKAQTGLQMTELESAIRKTHPIRYTIDREVAAGVGLGWFTSASNDTLVWHNGGTGGFHSFAGFNKEEGSAVVVLSNGKDNIDDIGRHLLDNRYELKELVSVDPNLLNRYAGTYETENGLQFRVERAGSRLLVQLTGQPAFLVFPKNSSRFYYNVVPAELEFSLNEEGTDSLMLYQNGRELPAAKVSDSVSIDE